MRLLTATVLGGAILAAGCTTNPYTGEQQVSKAATYGAGAAAVCGLVGAIDSSQHARNAALGCGIVGAGVGAYMDVQEAKLREQLQGTGVQVVREGDNIRLIMPGNITFNTDSYELRASFYPVLNSVALVVNEFEKTYVDVIGHTDSTGSAEYNQQLSVRRAQSVSSYLQSQKVLPEQLLTSGMGPNSPIASNDTPEGRALNRRVEIILTPLT